MLAALLKPLSSLYGNQVKAWGTDRLKKQIALSKQRKALEILLADKKSRQPNKTISSKVGKGMGEEPSAVEKFLLRFRDHKDHPWDYASIGRKRRQRTISGGNNCCGGKKLKGGKLSGREVVDILAGPIGWALLGARKKKEKDIARLKKEYSGGRQIYFQPTSYTTPSIVDLALLTQYNGVVNR